MIEAIRAAAAARGVTRICHLTPFRNLVHIATEGEVLSTMFLAESERRAFNQQDLLRLDAHPDHISCSIQYPNGWYLRQRRRTATAVDELFPDWVCLTIDPAFLWADETLFCPRNAAAEGGRLIARGADAFDRLYDDPVVGAQGRQYHRDRLPSACPTDEQAEVLVHRRIALASVQRLVVADESQARRVLVGLTQLGLPEDVIDYSICPEFFDVTTLSATLRSGRLPTEISWDPGSARRA